MTDGATTSVHRTTPLLRKIALAGVIVVVVIDARESFDSYSFAGEQWRVLLEVAPPPLVPTLLAIVLGVLAIAIKVHVVERLVARLGGDAHAGAAPVDTAGGARSSEGAKPAPPFGEEPNHRP